MRADPHKGSLAADGINLDITFRIKVVRGDSLQRKHREHNTACRAVVILTVISRVLNKRGITDSVRNDQLSHVRIDDIVFGNAFQAFLCLLCIDSRIDAF